MVFSKSKNQGVEMDENKKPNKIIVVGNSDITPYFGNFFLGHAAKDFKNMMYVDSEASVDTEWISDFATNPNLMNLPNPFFDCKCNNFIYNKYSENKVKKYNQRKVKIHCPGCGETKTMIIPKGHDLCPDCKGSGSIKDRSGSKIRNFIKCHKCEQTGLITWTDKVLK